MVESLEEGELSDGIGGGGASTGAPNSAFSAAGDSHHHHHSSFKGADVTPYHHNNAASRSGPVGAPGDNSSINFISGSSGSHSQYPS